ncbi:Disc-associated protein [Giardia muris]|uniref:Disc-associated protein n=1 Tax=Giardia muris TaxID=5742 RepID=A0A4Z1SW34_GIAMU|nr:Disc-associated protein [Giardia muris]|eukprot:TNJ29105.1 Disc-associated protein [Giardia muris]
MSRRPRIEDVDSYNGPTRQPTDVRGPRDAQEPHTSERQRGGFLDIFGSFDPFTSMRRMMDGFADSFRNFDRMFEEGQGGNAGGNVYMSSTTMTSLPGGITETRHRVRHNGKDIEEHVRTIGDRRVTSHRERDLMTGREDFRRDLLSVGEHEVDAFNRDFEDHVRRAPMRSLWDRDYYDRYDERDRRDRHLK